MGLKYVYKQVILACVQYSLAIKMFGLGGLFMKSTAYVPEGRNEGGRVATPTSFPIFDYDAMKSL